MRRFTIDIETRSLLNLQEDRLKYVMSRYTEICIISVCSWDYQVINYSIYHPESFGNLDKIKEMLQYEDAIFYAHNGLGFDFPILESKLGLTIPNYIDTLSLFAPYLNEKVKSLEVIAEQFGTKKNEDGKALIQRLALPRHKSFMRADEDFVSYCARHNKLDYKSCFSRPTRVQADNYLQYCDDDTIVLMDLLQKIPNNEDLELYTIDRNINHAGVRVDIPLAKKIMKEADTITNNIVEGCTLDEKELGSRDKLMRYLRRNHNLVIESCAADNLEAVLDNLDNPNSPYSSAVDKPEVREILEARLLHSKRCDSKVKTLLKLVLGDRLYNYLTIEGAHTGRWSSGGVQLHNLPGDNKKIAWAALQSLLQNEHLTSPAQIAALTRLLFVPDLGKTFFICDWSGIEARIAAWLADDTKKIEGFKNDVDFYKINATVFYQVALEAVSDEMRQMGKVQELGCGYQMGRERFVEYASSWGIHLTEDEAAKAVEAWRDNNPLIAGEKTGKTFYGIEMRKGGLWKDLQNSFFDCIFAESGFEKHVARCIMKRVGKDIFIQLPSGRHLFYRNVAMKMARVNEETEKTEWATQGGEHFLIGTDLLVDGLSSPAVRAFRAEGYRPQAVFGYNQTTKVYGGKLLENICQAIGACMLRNSVRTLTKHGYKIVLHVHDEIVVQLDKDNARQQASKVKALMSSSTSWSGDMPIGCEGFLSDRFSKKPIDKSFMVE